MINNLTPEEKEWWDREMDKYRRRARKEYRNPLPVQWIIMLVLIVLLVATCREETNPRPSPEQQMDDTILMQGVVHPGLPHGCPLNKSWHDEISSWSCVLLGGCYTDSAYAAEQKWVIDSCAPKGKPYYYGNKPRFEREVDSL